MPERAGSERYRHNPPLFKRLVSSAMKSSRLSNGRSREQCPHRPPISKHEVRNDTKCPRMRKTAIRLAWDEEIPGAAPGCATNFQTINQAPVAEQTTGIRLLNGTTQVQVLPGAYSYPLLQFTIPRNVKVAFPFVKRCVVVRVHAGEPFHGARPASRGNCLENSCT